MRPGHPQALRRALLAADSGASRPGTLGRHDSLLWRSTNLSTQGRTFSCISRVSSDMCFNDLTPLMRSGGFSTHPLTTSRNMGQTRKNTTAAASPRPNAWVGSAGAAGCDLRSKLFSRSYPSCPDAPTPMLTCLVGDTMTTPTSSMLAAIEACSLLDDVMNEDPTTIDLEAHCAGLAGKEAGLFVLSGTMGNQLGLRSLLTQPPYGVVCDHRSHIVKYEAGG